MKSLTFMIAAAACVVPAHAMRVAGAAAPSGTAAAVAPAAPTPPTLDLIAGTIDSIDVGARRLGVGGQVLGWNAGGLQVFGASGATSGPWELRPGQRIRFARAASTAPTRPVVLIYLEDR